MHYLFLLCMLLTLSCSTERKAGELFGPSEDDLLVVDAILLVNAPLPDLFVRRTLDPNAIYSREGAAVTNAEVTIVQDDNTFVYAVDPDSAGRYLPPPNPPLVQPQTRYDLHLQVDQRQVRATTTTPASIAIKEAVLLAPNSLNEIRQLGLFADLGDASYTAPENQIRYLEGLLEARIDPIDVPAYQIAIFSLDLDSDFVIDADFLEEDDYEEFEREGFSPPLEVSDGKVRLPWFAVAFAGRHLTRIYALDQNWYDYTRTNPQDTGGANFGGNTGDNFERPIFSLEGAIGLFGSAAVDSVGFFVLPAPKREQP